MKKSISIFCLLFVFTTKGFAQNYSFTNPNQSLLNINPSFAGSNGGLRMQSITQNEDLSRYNSSPHRSPYPSNRFHTLNNADVYLKKLHGAIAFSYSNDFYNNKYVKYAIQDFNLTYAQHFKIKNLKIIPSIQVSFLQSRQVYKDAFYGEYPSGWEVDYGGYIPPPRDTKKQDFDVNSGLLFQYKNFYGGVSAFHLIQPNYQIYNRYPAPMLFNFHASYNLIISEKTAFHFFTKYSAQQEQYPVYGNSAQIAVSAILFKHFIIGIGGLAGVVEDAMFTSQLGYRNNCFSVTLGYGGGFNYYNVLELSLSYNLRDKDSRKKPTAFEAW